jgi:hypothetical protein
MLLTNWSSPPPPPMENKAFVQAGLTHLFSRYGVGWEINSQCCAGCPTVAGRVYILLNERKLHRIECLIRGLVL